MLPKASSASLYDRPDSGRFLLPGLLEDMVSCIHVCRASGVSTCGTCEKKSAAVQRDGRGGENA